MDSCYDLVIAGGRVIDPENDVDAVWNIGIIGDKIAYAGLEMPSGSKVIDARGKIVAPGFIDLHSHAQNLAGHRLQALDGVTTSLELESGAAPLQASLETAQSQGRPLNYGYSAGWLHSRMIVMENLDAEAVAQLPTMPLDAFGALQAGTHWRGPASSEQLERIMALVEAQLAAGAIGIGVLLGYAPRTSKDELEALAHLAVRNGVPLFVHTRYGSNLPDHTPIEGLEELLSLSRRTGVQVHLCHFASSNASTVRESAALIARAQQEGLPFTTESYPFGLASTVIGAEFLDPELLRASHTPSSIIIVLETGEEVATYERLAELRDLDPGALCLIRYYDETNPGHMETLKAALSLQGAVFASDAMPVKPLGKPSAETPQPAGDATQAAGSRDGADVTDPQQWPLGEGYTVHPRSTSCFTRALSWLHRDAGVLGLSDVIARSSSLPAQILRRGLPAMANKGHLAAGADADVVVFDLEGLQPSTTFAPVIPSRGMEYVLVGGTEVVSAGRVKPDSSPGRPLYGAQHTPPTGPALQNTSALQHH